MAAMGQVLKLYRQRFGTIPVTISGEIRPLDIAATLSKTKNKLTISIVNPIWDVIDLPVEIINVPILDKGELWQVTAPDDMAFNHMKLKAGMVVSVEPAIYVYGYGGFRHSDTIIVGKDQPEPVTKYTKEISELTV